MNSGIQDAVNLAWKLALVLSRLSKNSPGKNSSTDFADSTESSFEKSVLIGAICGLFQQSVRGEAPVQLLGSYHSEREPVARGVLGAL